MAKFEQALKELIETLKRFPFVLALSLACVISLCFAQDESGAFMNFDFLKLAGTIGIAVPLFLSIKLLSERKSLSKLSNVFIYLPLIIGLILYYIFFDNHPVNKVRSDLLLISSWFSLFLIPHIGEKDQISYWDFNKTLILRAVMSSLFSLSLFLGVTLAITAVGALFNIAIIHRLVDLRIFAFLGIFVNMLILLMGVPKISIAKEEESNFPKILRLFAQYVLLPLSIIYLIILYAYSGKILIEFKLPNGWASGLISAYSAIGLFAFAALYPLKERWAKNFSKYFFYLLAPLFILLYFAINQRISDYGVTVERYFLVVSAIALLIITIYYIFSKKKSLKFIPFLITILPLVFSFGPWGAFSVSETSQTNRLIKLIEDNNIIENGIVIDDNISPSLRSEMQKLTLYLDKRFTLDKFDKYLHAKNILQKDFSKLKSVDIENYQFKRGSEPTYIDSINTLRSESHLYDCQNYNKLFVFSFGDIKFNPLVFDYNNDTFRIKRIKEGVSFSISIDGKKEAIKEININEFSNIFDKYFKDNNSGKTVYISDNEILSLAFESEKYKFKLYINSLEQNAKTRKIVEFSDFNLLIGKK